MTLVGRATSQSPMYSSYLPACIKESDRIIFSCIILIICTLLVYLLKSTTGRGSSIGSEFAWHASGPEFDPHARHILSWRLGHENISTAILPLPLIQEEQLSVIGKKNVH